MVADRAMFNQDHLKLLQAEGIKYIVAAKLRAMKKEIQSQFLRDNSCPIDEVGWVKDIPLEEQRLIVSYTAVRAKKDDQHRMKLVERLMKKTRNGKIPVQSLINNNGTKKYIQISESGKATLNEEKIMNDGVWDGIHGVITHYQANEKTPGEGLERYKGLWKIEEVFRINKNDLKMRPIYHFKSSRIRGHILLCFIAYTMTNYARHI